MDVSLSGFLSACQSSWAQENTRGDADVCRTSWTYCPEEFALLSRADELSSPGETTHMAPLMTQFCRSIRRWLLKI